PALDDRDFALPDDFALPPLPRPDIFYEQTEP
ncbi:hypothetical protein AB6A40_009778, partial [Gnathostoma spinigerum]